MERPNGRLASAMAYAALIHGTQTRKGTAIPYISHLMSVSALVMEFGGDEDQAIAGLLHDSLEDCGAEHEKVIRANYGNRVADNRALSTLGTPTLEYFSDIARETTSPPLPPRHACAAAVAASGPA